MKKATNLWILPSTLNVDILSSLHFGMVSYFRKRTLAHINGDVTSRTSLLYARKRSEPKQGYEGGCDWEALGDRFTGKLLPGCLADTGQSH